MVTTRRPSTGNTLRDRYATRIQPHDNEVRTESSPPDRPIRNEPDDRYIDELAAAEQMRDPATSTMKSQLLTIEDLANLPKLEPFIDQLIDFDSVVLTYGPRGCAKSFIAVDMTASAAASSRWHGRRVTAARTIYVVAEGAAGLGQRYQAWQGLDRNLGTSIGNDHLLILPRPVNLLSPSTAGEFADVAADLGARFIVFDTLARCMVGGDENSTKDAGIAIEQLDVIRRRTGACVLVVHHAGKNIDAGARGSSAFEAAADTVLRVGMTDDQVTITCTKQKNHITPNPIRLRLRIAGLSAVLDEYRPNDAEMPDSVVATLRALSEIATPGGVSTSRWEVAVDGSPRTFYRHLKRLLDEGLIENLGSTKMPKYQLTLTGTATAATVLP